MESTFFVIVCCLVLLAVFDLIVGVSNDAVNFLNSAFGSKVARRKTVLIVAAIGIAVGAMSSSGMMEIARKGIFNPEMFTFADVMVIFMAVMLTDILLLDLFNSFGMPTSTTVSIVFELLGAAFAIAILSLFSTGGEWSQLDDYLNLDNALIIISGIFLSVLVAFTLGVLVQYLVRMIFTFELDRSMKKWGFLFGGLALTTICYFLLVKGMKGSALVPESFVHWFDQNQLVALTGTFLFMSLASFALNRLLKVHILKMVVLVGTFSLAMAFAGNDLVNFIGVPIAGIQSYDLYQSTGIAADQMSMDVLNNELKANNWLLLAAGVIMIITLWFSKKARSVTETEINLARQSIGSERFRPNRVARLIVRGGLGLGKLSSRLMGDRSRKKIDQRFDPPPPSSNTEEPPAFDLLRAAVNLMMASILIAFATSLKLPLSTTYVSFMVAMGTSLADRAWNRDSAVYRVSGVMHVIGGWIFTAVVAFCAAACIALLIYYGGLTAIICLMILTAFLLIRSQLILKKIEEKKNNLLSELVQRDPIASEEVFTESQERIRSSLKHASLLIGDSLEALLTEDAKTIQKVQKEVARYRKESDDLSASFYYYLRKIDSEGTAEGRFYLHVLNHLQNVGQSIELIAKKTDGHLSNLHQPLEKEKAVSLVNLWKETTDDLDLGGQLTFLEDQKEAFAKKVSRLEELHILQVKHDQSTAKNSMLYIALLLEITDVFTDFTTLVALYQRGVVTYTVS